MLHSNRGPYEADLVQEVIQALSSALHEADHMLSVITGLCSAAALKIWKSAGPAQRLLPVPVSPHQCVRCRTENLEIHAATEGLQQAETRQCLSLLPSKLQYDMYT